MRASIGILTELQKTSSRHSPLSVFLLHYTCAFRHHAIIYHNSLNMQLDSYTNLVIQPGGF